MLHTICHKKIIISRFHKFLAKTLKSVYVGDEKVIIYIFTNTTIMKKFLLEGVIVSWKPEDAQTTVVTLLVLSCTQVENGKKWRFELPPLVDVVFDNRDHTLKQQVDLISSNMRLEVLVSLFENGSYKAILQKSVGHKPRRLEELIQAVEAVK